MSGVVDAIIVIILTMFCIAKLSPFYSCRHVCSTWFGSVFVGVWACTCVS